MVEAALVDDPLDEGVLAVLRVSVGDGGHDGVVGEAAGQAGGEDGDGGVTAVGEEDPLWRTDVPVGPQVVLDPLGRLPGDEDRQEVGDGRGGLVLGDDLVEDGVDDLRGAGVAVAAVEVAADEGEAWCRSWGSLAFVSVSAGSVREVNSRHLC
ncbi:hypothetical protein QP028_08495 [Corynebacterium suedekumii]|nr:hypothetical protein QP028_08495 [Corynebacterium suedekumii]